MVRNQAGKSPAIHERTVWCVKLLGIVMCDSEQDRHGQPSLQQLSLERKRHDGISVLVLAKRKKKKKEDCRKTEIVASHEEVVNLPR